jgi:hypothetical protein
VQKRIIYAVFTFLVLAIFSLWINEGRTSQASESILDTLHFAVPLFFALLFYRYWVGVGVFGGVFVATCFLLPWVSRADLGPLVYVTFWPLAALILFLIGHFVYRKTTTNEKFGKYASPILIILCLLMTPIIFTKYSSADKEFEKHQIYENLRCHGNEISVSEFQTACDRLTGDFWQPYYQDICFKELGNKKENGKVSDSFNYCPSR